MSINMEQRDSLFFMPKERFEPALKALRKLARKKRFAYMRKTDRRESFLELLGRLGWDASLNEQTGDIFRLQFIGEKLTDDFAILQVIAPCVRRGSFLDMEDGEGALWRWKFTGRRVIEQKGRIVYKETTGPLCRVTGRAFAFRSTMNKTHGKTAKPRKQVHIAVRGGVAYVEHCPAGVTVKITDYDNREEAPHAHRAA